MEIVRKENNDETKAILKKKDFIISPDPIKIAIPIWNKILFGLKTLYWGIIGAIAIIVAHRPHQPH